MTHRAMIEQTIPELTVISDNDRLSIENNKFQHWCNVLRLSNYILNKPRFTDKTWGWASSSTATGSVYIGGFYEFGSTHSNFSPALNFGTVNNSYAAHVFVVTGAETSDELVLRVTGTSITDAGVRVENDTDDITIPINTAANSYFEVKKFLGQVEISVVSGTPVNCNYGWCKYWDNRNTDFTISAIDATWFSESNTSNSNVILRHHKNTGWTYNASAEPTPPTPLAAMATDHSTERNTANGIFGAWKRTNLNVDIEGNGSEGIVIEIVAGSGKAFTFGNFVLTIEA